MSDRERQCVDRIGAEFASTMETVRNLAEWQREGNEEPHPEEETTLWEYGLSADYVAPETFGEEQTEGYFRWQLSWGGPSDEFRFYVSPSKWGYTPHNVEYWFLDWWDGAHKTLTGDDLTELKDVFDMIFADPTQMVEDATEG